MPRAIALISGGLKSAVLLASQREAYEVACLFVDLGLPTSTADYQSMQQICGALGCRDKAVRADLSTLGEWEAAMRSPRVRDEPAADNETTIESPGPMPVLLHAATLCAVQRSARTILVGVTETPSPGSADPPVAPRDHQREFFHIYDDLLRQLVPPPMEITIDTPLIDLTYEEIVRLGRKLDAPLHLSHSCQSSGDEPCGRCRGCRRRAAAFQHVGEPDLLATSQR